MSALIAIFYTYGFLDSSVTGIYFLLCMLTPCLIYGVYFCGKGRKISIPHFLLILAFLVYLEIVLRIVNMGVIGDISHFGKLLNLDSLNFRPFASFGSISYFLNILLFIPMGFALPLMAKRYHNLWLTVGSGFLFSLLIELSQLLNIRCSDVDDLITNTFGVLLGYALWLLCCRGFKWQKYPRSSLSPREPGVFMLLSFLGVFFLYNFWLFW